MSDLHPQKFAETLRQLMSLRFKQRGKQFFVRKEVRKINFDVMWEEVKVEDPRAKELKLDFASE